MKKEHIIGAIFWGLLLLLIGVDIYLIVLQREANKLNKRRAEALEEGNELLQNYIDSKPLPEEVKEKAPTATTAKTDAPAAEKSNNVPLPTGKTGTTTKRGATKTKADAKS